MRQQRPIFGFLWHSTPEPRVDAQAVQVTWRRVPARGPWRLTALLGATALLITAVGAMVSALIAQPTVIGVVISVVVAIPCAALLGRAWAAGTSVSDAGVKISQVLTTTVVEWPEIDEVVECPGSKLLGLPIVVGGATVNLRSRGRLMPTQVATGSPDLLLRPQAFAASADALRTWWRETRSSAA